MVHCCCLFKVLLSSLSFSWFQWWNFFFFLSVLRSNIEHFRSFSHVKTYGDDCCARRALCILKLREPNVWIQLDDWYEISLPWQCKSSFGINPYFEPFFSVIHSFSPPKTNLRLFINLDPICCFSHLLLPKIKHWIIPRSCDVFRYQNPLFSYRFVYTMKLTQKLIGFESNE